MGSVRFAEGSRGGSGPSTSALAHGHARGAGERPPDPKRGPVSAKRVPVRLAEGSRGGNGPSTSVLAQGHAGGAGAPPTGPGPVSAKWVPARLAEGSRGGSGPSTRVLAQGHASGAGERPPDPCSRGPVSAKRLPMRLAEGSHEGRGRGAGTPLPKGSCRCIQSLPRLSPCSLLSLLFLLHGCAVRLGHSGGAFKLMHSLQPKPETVSNSCMSCCQSLRLSQTHACPAARA